MLRRSRQPCAAVGVCIRPGNQAVPGLADAYMDLVRYVEKPCDIKVSRYTTSGFMRLKLGNELAKRKVFLHVFESQTEANKHIQHD